MAGGDDISRIPITDPVSVAILNLPVFDLVREDGTVVEVDREAPELQACVCGHSRDAHSDRERRCTGMNESDDGTCPCISFRPA